MADTPISSGLTLLPPGEPPISPSTVPDQEPTRKPSELPPVTTGTSSHHIQGLAAAASRASATDPLTIMFQIEKQAPGTPPPDLSTMQRLVYEAALGRLASKIAAGGFIAEAGGFAAVACWEPAQTGGPYYYPGTDPEVLARERPAFAEFLVRDKALMEERFYPVADRVSGGRYWKLSLMARDPGVPYLPGAVRAVLVPFIERFTSEQNEGGPMPVWLEAGSEQARAVYAHYGFRDVGEMIVRGVKTWGMVYTGNIDIEKGGSGTS